MRGGLRAKRFSCVWIPRLNGYLERNYYKEAHKIHHSHRNNKQNKLTIGERGARALICASERTCVCCVLARAGDATVWGRRQNARTTPLHFRENISICETGDSWMTMLCVCVNVCYGMCMCICGGVEGWEMFFFNAIDGCQERRHKEYRSTAVFLSEIWLH